MHDILGRLNALNTPSKQTTTANGKNILRELKPAKKTTATRLVESYEEFKKNYEKMDSEPAIDRKRKAKQKRDGAQYTKKLNKDVGASVFRNKRGVSEDIDIDTFYEDTMKELDAMGGQCDCGDCEECNNRNKEKVNESVLKESSLDMIASQFPKEVRDFSRGAEMSEDLYYALYDFYSPDMPYGTKKARDGDPMEWVARHFDDAIQNGEVHITESNLTDEDTTDLGNNNDGNDAEFGDDGLDNGYSSDFGDNGLGDMGVAGDIGSFDEFGSADFVGSGDTMGDFGGMGDSYGGDDELNELARLAGLDNPGNKTFGIDEVYESDDMKKQDFMKEEYSSKNPKIDLYCDGKYVASTNYSKTVKEAIKKYKEKHPNKEGKITGEISKKNVNESEEYDNNYTPQDLVQAYNELTHYNQHTEAAIELATFLGRDDLIPRLRKLQDAIDDPRASNSERNAWLSKRDAIANVLYHNPKVQKAFGRYDVKTPTQFEWEVVDSSTHNVIDTIPTSKDRKEARARAIEMGYDMNDVFIRPKKSVNEDDDGFVYTYDKKNPPRVIKKGFDPETGEDMTYPGSDEETKEFWANKRAKFRDGSSIKESMLPQAYDTQQSGMNINSSLDTRTGTKSLSVTATGEDAEQLAQILRMAGIGSEQTQEPDSDCYGTQDMGKHIAMLRVSQPIEEDFANEPDEEYVPLDTILDQGTDLNRKKTQYSHSYKQGDNPMAMEGQKMFSKLYKAVKGK